MSQTIVFNGVVYTIPNVGDDSWGQSLSDYLLAIPQGALQKSGGSFTLAADINFGPTYGILSRYFSTREPQPSVSGLFRMSLIDTITWRNNANNADLILGIDADDQLTFNGSSLQVSGDYLTGLIGDVLAIGPGVAVSEISPNAVTNDKVRQSSPLSVIGNSSDVLSNIADIIADTDHAVLMRTGTALVFNLLTNNNISPSAAIDFSKMVALSASRVLISDGSGLVSASTITSTELGYLSGVTSNIQTQLNATISNNNPTFTGIVTVPVTPNRALITNSSSALSASVVTDTELGYVSGVTSALQTQLNSKITNPLTTTGDMIYSSAGSTASRIALGSSGQVLKVIGGVPSWSTFSGGINYASSNPDFEADTAGWSTYADAASALPVDGTGGTPNITITRSTSNPLRGTASGLITKDAANRQGQGVAYNFTIDKADTAKIISVNFDYAIDSGTYSGGTGTTDSDLTIYIYDVTNATIIQPAGYKIVGAVIGQTYKQIGCTFQSASNSTSYRILFHVATTSTSAWALKVDTIQIGPNDYSVGAPITDFASQTFTLTNFGNATQALKTKRIGDCLIIRGSITVGSTVPTGILEVGLPTGLVIDSTKLSASFDSFGMVECQRASGVAYTGSVFYNSSTTLRFQGDSGLAVWTPTVPVTLVAGDIFQLNLIIPIAGWSSSVLMSNDTDTRVVAFRSNSAPTGTLNSSVNVARFTAVSNDTHGAYNTTTGIYRISVPGFYSISAQLDVIGSGVSVGQFLAVTIASGATELVRNSAVIQDVAATETITSVSYLGYFNAGDQITPNSVTNIASPTYSSTIQRSYLQIFRLSGPSQIAASEAINCAYNTTTSIVNGSANPVIYTVKDYDSHSAYNTTDGTYRIPISGRYRMSAGGLMTGTASAGNSFQLNIQINGVDKFQDWVRTQTGTMTYPIKVSGSMNLLAGDLVRTVSQTSATGASFVNAPGINHFEIEKVD